MKLSDLTRLVDKIKKGAVLSPSEPSKAESPPLPKNNRSQGKIDANQDRFIITFPPTSDEDDFNLLVARVRNLPAAEFADLPYKHWWLPIGLTAATALQSFTSDPRFVFTTEAKRQLTITIENSPMLLALSHNHKTYSPRTSARFSDMGITPRNYQYAAWEYIQAAGNTMIADPTGIGKSIEALMELYHMSGKALFIVPKNTLLKWKREAERAIPGINVQILDKKSLPSATTTLFLINYDIISDGWKGKTKRSVRLSEVIEKVMSFGIELVVLDESHRIKKKTGVQRTHACLKIGRYKSVKRKLCLTATPTKNGRPEELIPQLEFLDRLDELGGLTYYRERYCATEGRARPYEKYIPGQGYMPDYSGCSNEEELQQKLRATCLIRRDKREVLPDLPDIERIVVPVEISNRAEYNRASKDLARYLCEQKNGDIKAYISAKLTEAAQKYNALRQLTTAGKRAAIKEWLEDYAETGEKVIGFSWFRESQIMMTELMESTVGNTVHVYGTDKQDERDAAIDAFQNDAKVKGISLSLAACSEGIDLFAADTIIQPETPLTPGDQEQAEARAWRSGQTRKVKIYIFVGVDTIDETVQNMIGDKAANTGGILDGGAKSQQEALAVVLQQLKDQYSGVR